MCIYDIVVWVLCTWYSVFYIKYMSLHVYQLYKSYTSTICHNKYTNTLVILYTPYCILYPSLYALYIGMLSRIEEEKSSLSAEKDQLIRALDNLQKSTAANRLVCVYKYIVVVVVVIIIIVVYYFGNTAYVKYIYIHIY